MKKASRTQRSNRASAVGRSELGSFILLSTIAILLAASVLTLDPSIAQTRTGKKSAWVKPLLPQQLPQQLSVKLSSSRNSVSSCPGKEKAAQVQLTTSGLGAMGRQAQYDWKVSGGTIKDKGASAIWSLSGVPPGSYSATVRATVDTIVAVHSTSSETRVIVERCQPDSPSCPQVSMSLKCDQTVNAGSRLRSRVAWRGGTPGVNPTYEWSATAGRIVRGQGTREIVFDTTGADGQTITLMLELRGFGLSCTTPCRMFVQPLVKENTTPTPTPTITPSPTQTPTPTPSPPVTPTPSPSPSPSAVANASPSPSPVVTPTTSPDGSLPTPTPIPFDTPGVQSERRLWPWILIGVFVGLLGVALLLSKIFSFPLLKAMAGVIMGKQKVADEVHCTVFAPGQAAPGDPFMVQVFAHLAEHAEQLTALAAKADPDALDRDSTTLSKPIKRETKITFILEMPGLEVPEPKQSLVWRGLIDRVQFAVDVPAGCKPQNVRGVVRIYYGRERAPIGRIMFMFKIAEAGAPAPPAASIPSPPPQEAVKYTHAFISYCSDDRRQVLLGLRGLRKGWKLAGITYFIDLQDIKSGEYWREVIKLNLDKCDLFVLFWSSAAKCSEEVMKEVNYALVRRSGNDKALPDFEPYTIELPIPEPLPEGLESLHFGDDLLYFIKAEETLKAERAGPDAGDDQN
jgi:hypothetical protein